MTPEDRNQEPSNEGTESSTVDELHDRLFEERPAKEGTRLERITALVFAALDEGNVYHQVMLQGQGRQARHWIDVETRRSDGSTRAVIECKHWKKRVNQDVINSIVGRRDQLGAEQAMVVSTVGFTSGAIDVATDEGVRLVRVHALAENEQWYGVVKEIRMQGTFGTCNVVELQWRAVDPSIVESLKRDGKYSTWGTAPLETGVEYEDGSPAEIVSDLMKLSPSPHKTGRYDHEVPLSGTRFLRLDDETRIEVQSLTWIEDVHIAEVTHTFGPPSPGRLLVEEVVSEGAVKKRVLMDHELRTLQIEDSGHVTPKEP